MGFADAVRTQLAAARAQTADLQVEVIYEAWVGQDGRAGPRYDPSPRKFDAFVSLNPHKRKLDSGVQVDVRATVSFAEEVAPHGAPQRKEPIDARDATDWIRPAAVRIADLHVDEVGRHEPAFYSASCCEHT